MIDTPTFSRLGLGIVAGFEDPKSDFGMPGSGKLPEDSAILKDVVATFNGAFKSVHGRYGMKEAGRLLVAPVEGAFASFFVVAHQPRPPGAEQHSVWQLSQPSQWCHIDGEHTSPKI